MKIAPVVLIIFNRPEKTSIVFESIRAVKPSELFIIADGPRRSVESDLERINKCREIVGNVDWPCNIYKNYADVNLGCRERVRSGLDWVFSIVDKAIILEDDCLPVPAFFTFCSILLEQYQSDVKITHIAGCNPLADSDSGSENLNFIKTEYYFIWGWATWADKWRDYYDSNFSDLLRWRTLVALFRRHGWRFYFWVKIFIKTKYGLLNTWDHQWTYGNWKYMNHAIIPSSNLIRNIGFDSNATHTKVHDGTFSDLKCWRGELAIDSLLTEVPNDKNFGKILVRKLFK